MTIAVFLAIGTLSYSTFILYKKRKLDVSLLILSCFALVLGFQSVSEDILSGVLFEPIVHSILSHVFIILTSVLIISYYLTRMIYYKKIYGLFCIVQISIQLGVLVYSLMTPNELPELMPIVNVVSVISTLVTSLASIGEAYKNNRFFCGLYAMDRPDRDFPLHDLYPICIRNLSSRYQLVNYFIRAHFDCDRCL